MLVLDLPAFSNFIRAKVIAENMKVKNEQAVTWHDFQATLKYQKENDALQQNHPRQSELLILYGTVSLRCS